MNATRTGSTPIDLPAINALGRLLEQLDRSRVPVDPDQYRTVVSRLSDMLKEAENHAGVNEVLNAFPAAAELYENLNYRHAGLCRSSLDRSLASEMDAKRAIADAMRQSTREREKRDGHEPA